MNSWLVLYLLVHCLVQLVKEGDRLVWEVARFGGVLGHVSNGLQGTGRLISGMSKPERP